MARFKKGHKGYFLGKKRPNLHSDEAKEKISVGNKGKKMSEKARKKISIAMTGREVSDETKKKIGNYRKGKPSPAKGKKWSKEARIRFSKSQSGENGNNWKGGLKPVNKRIRAGIEFRLWREAVFARDNWTCQVSGVRGGKLVPHHLQNFAEYPELRFAIDNGVTLSKEEHAAFHKQYGYTKNTVEQFIKFKENWKQKLWEH